MRTNGGNTNEKTNAHSDNGPFGRLRARPARGCTFADGPRSRLGQLFQPDRRGSREGDRVLRRDRFPVPRRSGHGRRDARLRYQIGRAPSIAGGVEIIEVSKANLEPVSRSVQDPGAVTLVATVRDLDGAIARLKQLGAPVVTRSGAPIKVGTVGRMIVVQDPAGHFIEIVQPEKLTEAQAAATGNVVGVRVRFTVRDVESA